MSSTVPSPTTVTVLSGGRGPAGPALNLTGHVISSGNAAVLGSFSSSNLSQSLTDETGTGQVVFSNSPVLVTPLLTSATLVTPNLGTPSAIDLANATGLPVGTGIDDLGAGTSAALEGAADVNGGFALFEQALGTADAPTFAGVVSTDFVQAVTFDFSSGERMSSSALALSCISLTTSKLAVRSGAPIGWSSSATVPSTALDVAFSRTAANTLALGNGTALNATGSLALANITLSGTLGATTIAVTNLTASNSTLTAPDLGTPSVAVLTNATGLPVATGVSGLGAGSATALASAVDTSGGVALYEQALGTTDSPQFLNLTTTGGRIRNVTEVNVANYDIVATDDIIHVTYTTTGAVTSLTWPSTQMIEGRQVVIKDAGLNATTNTITIDTQGAQTIDGAATAVIGTDGASLTLYCDGVNLFTI